MGLAMHFEETGQILPLEGGVFVRIYSNVVILEGKVPDEIFQRLQPTTLSQGRKTLRDQFRYGVHATEDGGATMSYASFRRSFAVLAITARDLATFSSDDLPESATPFSPGNLQRIALPSFSAGVVFRTTGS